MNNVLRIERDRLALEAGLPIALDLSSLLQKTLPSITAGFAGLVGRFQATDPAIPLPAHEQEFLRTVLKHTYLNIAPLAAYVPEGLEVSYEKYLRTLVAAVDHAANYSPKHIGNFAMLLSQLVTSTEQKLSTVSTKRENAESERQRKKLNEDMGRCFGNGSTRTERSIGDVIDRNSDWQQVLQQNGLQVKLINSVNRQDLNKKLATCVELMNTLMAKVQRGELQGISREAAVNIADGAYSAAEEAEFYAAVYYKSMAFSEALNRTMNHFKTVFNKK